MDELILNCSFRLNAKLQNVLLKSFIEILPRVLTRLLIQVNFSFLCMLLHLILATLRT